VILLTEEVLLQREERALRRRVYGKPRCRCGCGRVARWPHDEPLFYSRLDGYLCAVAAERGRMQG
jgi:hypothetical protein